MYGSELPRIFTPPLRELVAEVRDDDGRVVVVATTLGYECIEFADTIGVHLFPWEKWFLIHALELLPNGTLRFRTLILLVARQNGKTTLLKILALFWMVVLGRMLVIGTAQNLDIAEETWADTLALAESSEEIAPFIEQVIKQSGKKTLSLNTGEKYKVKASSGSGPRGLSGDLIEMDELREHHNWESWAAVSSTTMAIDSALVIAASNAGDLLSVVLRQLRFMCMMDPRTVGVTQQELESLGQLPASDDQPDDMSSDTVGIFEWSALPGCGIWDKAGWAAANPSFGYTISEAAMATQARIAAAGGEAEWVFRTENLCQWRPTAGGGPFPSSDWEAGVDPQSDLMVDQASPIGICVDVSNNRSMAYVALAALRTDGHVHVQVVAQRAGVEWLIPWLTANDRTARDRWCGVTWQLNGAPVSSLTDAMRETDLPIVEWGGGDLTRASGQMYDLVRMFNPDDEEDDPDKQRVFHLPQPVLDRPASTAKTKLLANGGWVIDRVKSPTDAAPLMAAIGAVWVLLRPEEPKKIPQVHEWPADLVEQMKGW